MERSQLSRDFSSRVEVNFHRHPNVFRRWMWVVSLALGTAAAGGLIWNAKYGRPEIYSGGRLSDNHRMFENRCEVCHRPWSGPLERLASLGQDAHASSASDEQCLVCHAGPGHFFSGGSNLPWEEKSTVAHLSQSHFQSCAACHREHHGAAELRQIAGASCVECHADLEDSRVMASQLESLTFQRRGAVKIEDFSGHPEFAMHELRTLPPGASDGGSTGIPASHGARSVLDYFQRPDEVAARWQDRGRLRFNHALHLRDAGVVDSRGETHVLRENCSSCHEPDEDRRYMRPIRYDKHCSSCHPLVFDPGLVQDERGEIFSLEWESGGSGRGLIRSRVDSERTWGLEELRGASGRFRLLTAPHGRPVEVRGYLTDVYAGELLGGGGFSGSVVGGSVDVIRPGRANSGEGAQISPADRQRISAQVSKAEELVQSSNFPRGTGEEIPGLFRSLGWLQGSGGCRYCHETDDGGLLGELDGELFVAGAAPLPAIRRPRLPERWYVHSEFNHDSHRMMTCTDCHSGVGVDRSPANAGVGVRAGLGAGLDIPSIFESRSTGDVLMPRLESCRQCHAEEPSAGVGLKNAGTECVTCHKYHQRQFEVERHHSIEELLGGAVR
jgi:hypothetical protein